MIHLGKETAGFAMNKEKTDNKNVLVKNKLQKIELYLFFSLSFMLFIHAASSTFASVENNAFFKKIPEICYQCHTKLKESMSGRYVHFPFRDGKCLACHSSHAGKLKGLLRQDVNSLCMSCHEGIRKLLENNFKHHALKKGTCTDCHRAHGGENRKLLTKTQKEICWQCHDVLKEQLKEQHVHEPFRDGECSLCHEPHASSQENHLRDNPNTLCKRCHPPKCKAERISITFATEKLDCTSCHGGHASRSRALFGPYGHSDFLEARCDKCHNPITTFDKITTRATGKNLCLNCHKLDSSKLKDNDIHLEGGCIFCHPYHASKKKNFTMNEAGICMKCHENTENRTSQMEKALKSIRCAPVKRRECFECHVPPHSLKPLYLKGDEIVTCAKCHAGQHKVAHPLGPDVKDPRNNKTLTCITCHGMHSSKAEFLLYFDRKRQLCIQCHKK